MVSIPRPSKRFSTRSKASDCETWNWFPVFFNQTFPTFTAKNLTFSFAHSDVNLYDSYKSCLEFFYPRLTKGGIMLFDEYNDPPWPAATRQLMNSCWGGRSVLSSVK